MADHTEEESSLSPSTIEQTDIIDRDAVKRQVEGTSFLAIEISFPIGDRMQSSTSGAFPDQREAYNVGHGFYDSYAHYDDVFTEGKEFTFSVPHISYYGAGGTADDKLNQELAYQGEPIRFTMSLDDARTRITEGVDDGSVTLPDDMSADEFKELIQDDRDLLGIMTQGLTEIAVDKITDDFITQSEENPNTLFILDVLADERGVDTTAPTADNAPQTNRNIEPVVAPPGSFDSGAQTVAFKI